MEPIVQALIAALASFSFVSLLFSSILLLCRRPKPPSPLSSIHHHTSHDDADDGNNNNVELLFPSLPHISLSDLAAATSNFSPDLILGDGVFGFVYKAVLPSGSLVAVKRLSPDLARLLGFRQFRAEIETLGRLRHPNLALLLAYCSSGPDRLLIYEFLPGGSLDHRLHHPHPPLPWPPRLRSLRGVASGLAFLHHLCNPSVIHRDIKAANVLLDDNLEPRIADFGLARLLDTSRSHVSTLEAAGTLGYMPPEYKGGLTAASVKGDVYSFGALAIEVLTGRRPSWPVKGGDGVEMGMVEWARREVVEGRGMGILDPLMEREGVVEAEVMGVLEVACWCTDEVSKNRPTMGMVAKHLDNL